jgi:hypothetical protein
VAALRASYPTSPAELAQHAALSRSLGIGTDVLAAAAIASAAVSTYLTVREHRGRRVDVALSPLSLGLRARF